MLGDFWATEDRKMPQTTVGFQFIPGFMGVSTQEYEVHKKNIHLAFAFLHGGPWWGSHT